MEFRVQRHGVVESTNELALAALESGEARHGDVHVATAQTAGRGRRGASWFSPEGAGLYLSLVWMPPPERVEIAGLSMAAGLAVRDAVGRLGARGVRLKWPNDLLVGDAKLCGVLIESRGLDPRAPRVVIGIGLNVGTLEPPPELAAERAVTSLAELGVEADPDSVLDELLPALARRLGQLAADTEAMIGDYLAAAELTDREVRVDGPEELHGRLVGLDLEAGLTLIGAGGVVRTLQLGHVRGLTPA